MVVGMDLVALRQVVHLEEEGHLVLKVTVTKGRIVQCRVVVDGGGEGGGRVVVRGG